MGWDDMDVETTFSSLTTATDFDQCYFSYPLSHISKTNYETGSKIIIPASALDQLASLNVVYPMLFRIENPSTGLHSHCGVVEFTAEEGFVFLPNWMMNNMQLQEGDLINIKNTSLPKGTYIKIQPHATKFTTLSNHKSLLEKSFRDFVCLTTGDTTVVNHGDEKYMMDIVETKPSPAILLFETDCEVDFAPPLDYKKPEKKTTTPTEKDSKLFPGAGMRLGGTHVWGDDTDLPMKKLETKHEVEFKAFTGVARRVDGQSLAAVDVDEITQQEDQSSIQVDVKKIDHGFNAFTGKSYRLL